MAIQMTRAEYVAKFGKEPIPASAPIQQPKQPLSNRVANFFGAKGITEQFGASLARATVPEEQKQFVDFPKPKEVIGSAIQTGANLIPGVGGSGFLTKLAVGAGTGLAFDIGSKLQAGEPVKPGIGTAVGATIPIAGAVARPVTRIVGRLFKGLGSGASGVSVDTIDKIVSNPKAAQLASEKLSKSGNAKVLEDNARQIMKGITDIKNQARSAYGKGLESLSKTDIKPEVFRARTQKFLDKYGVSTSEKGRKIAGAEFSDPTNLKKANALINRLQGSELDGRSLRKLADDIESARYKVATSDERLSFNAFLKDFAEELKGAVGDSTDKLKEINKAFSSDMQLAETAEDIFGNVKFNNLQEVVKASQKLEGMFAQKGLAPKVTDDFLTKIGVDAEGFKTSEAVRQISNKTQKANEVGLGVGELIRGVTSSIITPQMVRDISIKTGLAESVLLPELRKLSPLVRDTLMNALVQGGK